MPIDLQRFYRCRPYLYHLTSSQNIDRIFAARRLDSAGSLLRRAGCAALIREKRCEHLQLTIEGQDVWVRDQAVLYQGKMGLSQGWTFHDLIEELNERIFFWPGKDDGPVDSGKRHFGRYAAEGPKIIRVRANDLVDANPDVLPEFCRYNSGSPRVTMGKKSPRGDGTFQPAQKATFRPSEVVEVTFRGSISLPEKVEFGWKPEGPWEVARSAACFRTFT